VPYHAANMYIAKLIEKGYKVAICEQLEDPKAAKGIVKRDVIRVVTPGTVLEDNLLEEKKNNYIMSIYKQGIFFGVSVCDISTGDFLATQIKETNNFAKLLDEIARYYPAEIVVNEMLYSCTEEIGKIKVELEKFPEDPYGYYLGGHCVSFSDILCTIFDGYSVRYQSMDHVIVKIGNHFYDVRGIIDAFVTEDYKIVNDDKSMQEMYNLDYKN